jgi:hypothetical protein
VDNALKAKQDQQWSASNRALELLGKELGMFDDRSVLVMPWDGDLNKLTAVQIGALRDYVLRMALGNNPEKIEAMKRQMMIEAGAVVIEAESALTSQT